MLCVVVLEVEDGDFSDLKFSALDVHSGVMHLSMLICWGGGGGGGKPGIGWGFELRSVFLFQCLAPGKSSWVKKMPIPHPRGIIVGQKSANSPTPSSSQKCIGKKEQQNK